MSIINVDLGRFCRSWSILSIFGLSILKLALRGLARAHWTLPQTSMVTRSQNLTLGQWTNGDLFIETQICEKHRLQLSIDYIENRSESNTDLTVIGTLLLGQYFGNLLGDSEDIDWSQESIILQRINQSLRYPSLQNLINLVSQGIRPIFWFNWLSKCKADEVKLVLKY